MTDAKKYGLIIKKKTKESHVKKSSVFGNDSSDEEEVSKSNVNISLMREAQKKKQMKQTQIEIEKALKEDPTVYEYDNIYDDMAEKKKAAIPKLAEKNKKPKYIKGLLESAKARKMEDERRMERQIQKEREQEGGEFQDKEEFVTSAYRKRMLELEEEEKRLKKQEALDAANDVTKRTDLTMFYSNLLKHNVSMGGSFAVDAERENKSSEKDTSNDTSKEIDKKHDEKVSIHKGATEHPIHSRREDRDHRDREELYDSGRRHRDSDEHHRDYHRRRRRSSSSEERSHHRGRDDHKRRESRKESDSSKSSHRPSERHRDRESPRNDRSDEEPTTSKDNKLPEKEPVETVETDSKSEQDGKSSKFAKRSTNETVSSARERFLERKRAREIMLKAKPADDSDED